MTPLEHSMQIDAQTLGQAAYELRCEGVSWNTVAWNIYPEISETSQVKACLLAKSYAKTYKLPWPIPLPQ